jgi:dipeptidyl aminopeptidase/acylaminoacyl peptidase
MTQHARPGPTPLGVMKRLSETQGASRQRRKTKRAASPNSDTMRTTAPGLARKARRLPPIRGAAYASGMRGALFALASAAALCASSGAAAAHGAGVAQDSPACSSITLVAWSPDGTQIAFSGRRLGHGALPLRAICVARADGKNATPLPHTLCSRRCRLDLIDSPSQLYWVVPKLILYGDDFRIFLVPLGGKPKPLGSQPGSFEQFSVDAAGDRVAAGNSACPRCAGPVTVLDVPSGKVVGRLGGSKFDNIGPSISPDGSQVVFERDYAHDSSSTLGLWTADADGSHLHRLVQTSSGGTRPLWSPAGDRIAYVEAAANSSALLLIPAHGGGRRTLVPHGVEAVFGWSPNAQSIAFEARGRLEVVNVESGKVRPLLELHFAPSVAWSPDSHQLLVNTWPRAKGCRTSLWRVPASGGKPRLLRHC